MRRLAILETEVVRVSKHVERISSRTERYPEDIAGFQFCNNAYSNLIEYWPPADADSSYVISYDLFVGETKCREYSQDGWYYYDD